jgi:histidine triad (HIT) family protein
MGHIVGITNTLAGEEGINQSGYRLVVNCGNEGWQLVPHVHIHLLGGRKPSDIM